MSIISEKYAKFASNIKSIVARYPFTPESEKRSLLLLAPVFLAAGIACLYSYLPEIPDYEYLYVTSGFFLASASLFVSALLIKRSLWLKVLCAVCAIFIVGCGFAMLEVNAHNQPLLRQGVEKIWLEGNIANREKLYSGCRITLSEITSRRRMQLPHSVRIKSLRNCDEVYEGDRILVLATLMPLPRPSYPGGYDFAKSLFFDGIGAVGYSISRLIVLKKNEDGEGVFTTFRRAIGDSIEGSIGRSEAGIGTSLVTGEQRLVESRIIEAYRNSGIVHLLSISGFHIGLISILAFWVVRFVMILPGERFIFYNPKKIAAVASIAFSYCYLMVSGAEVAAVRSFVMVAIMMLAILVNRRAITLTNIAWAAILILCFSPSSLYNPGFQLSFAATTGLVYFYERFSGYFRWMAEGRGLHITLLKYVGGIVLTSIIAGAITAPLAIANFGQMHNYSLPANLVAMPLTSFIIMPFLLIGVLLIPLELHHLFFVVAGYGISILNLAALEITSWPGSVTWFTPPDSLVSGIAAGAFILFISVRYIPLRIIGIVVFLLFLPLIFISKGPDILVDEKNLALRKGRDVYLLSPRQNFATDTWRAPMASSNYLRLRDLMKLQDVSCSNGRCNLEVKGNRIELILPPPEFARSQRPEIIINGQSIDADTIYKAGAHAIYLDSGRVETAVPNNSEYLLPWQMQSK